jgi:hypothetical protein
MDVDHTEPNQHKQVEDQIDRMTNEGGPAPQTDSDSRGARPAVPGMVEALRHRARSFVERVRRAASRR